MTPTLAVRARQAGLFKVAVMAFAAMCIEDALGTVMVVFENQAATAHSSVWVAYAALAGVFDGGAWLAGIVCSALALESILSEGFWTRRSLVLIGAVTWANLSGTFLGVLIARGISHH